ncbi:MAG: hypothetical protein HYW65_04410 [Candidatus Liptonbacteria bacterium]|nr:hypothetical protein [Candidatus Liptonbacteria bacterium]MBI3114637.1 hypothetical protein [Candidatus Harrisonbacteria bacterium]
MSIIGHSRVIKTLKRLADEKRLAHGYLFFGPKGVGKRRAAESLAHYCEGGAFAPAARVLNDARMVVPDEEGSIGIDAARALKLFLYERPNVSPYRLAIVDEAERLTPQAQNALLKVAEEPPSSGVLIFVVSDPEALLSTLRSRLHALYFGSSSTPKSAVGESDNRNLDDARRLLAAAPPVRREMIKKLIAPEDFDFPRFLDACIAVASEEIGNGKRNYARWHRLLALRHESARGTLNARVQLQALFTDN